MPHPNPTDKTCAAPDCANHYRDSGMWAAIKAGGEGWFLQRNGSAWCPEHIPDWVAGWRERQAAKKHPPTS